MSLAAHALSDEVRDLFENHADFVWRALARCGVRDADLRDATQEVFITVARRLADRDGTSSVTTWLYGISMRIAANYRRKAHRRYEETTDLPPEIVDTATPEEALGAAQARQRLAAILDAMPEDQRLVFVMFEMDGLSCPEIAEKLAIPLGTTYTRLRAARATFEAQVKRLSRGDGR